MLYIETADHFAIGIDPAAGRCNIIFTGLWTDDVVAAFGDALNRAIAVMIEGGAPYGSFRTLFDVSQSTLLPRSVSALIGGLASDHGPASVRVAIVVSSVLQKIQYQRVAPQSMFSYFFDEHEAVAWLRSPLA